MSGRFRTNTVFFLRYANTLLKLGFTLHVRSRPPGPPAVPGVFSLPDTVSAVPLINVSHHPTLHPGPLPVQAGPPPDRPAGAPDPCNSPWCRDGDGAAAPYCCVLLCTLPCQPMPSSPPPQMTVMLKMKFTDIQEHQAGGSV